MTDLKKLDELVTDLESQTKSLKSFEGVYSEIAKLEHEIGENLQSLSDNNSSLKTATQSVTTSMEMLEKRQEELLCELRQTIASKLEEVEAESRTFNAKIRDGINEKLENIDSSLFNIQSNLSSKLNELESDGKKFQKELDSSLVTRLDKLQSNIQVEIRDEATRSAKTIEGNIRATLLAQITEQTKQVNLLKLIVIANLVGVAYIIFSQASNYF